MDGQHSVGRSVNRMPAVKYTEKKLFDWMNVSGSLLLLLLAGRCNVDHGTAERTLVTVVHVVLR